MARRWWWGLAAVAVTRGAVRLGRRSGLSDAEVAMALPGDDVVPGAAVVVDRGMDLPAPPEVVWPWLVQLGLHRGGWYCPRVVDALVPRSWRATRRVEPRWQGLAVGDAVPDWGQRTATGEPELVLLVREEHRVLAYRSDRPRTGGRPPMTISWTMALRPLPAGGTRVHHRLRMDGFLLRPRAVVPTLAGLVDGATVVLLHAGLAERVRG